MLLVLGLTIGVRLLIISNSPSQNSNIDLGIYREVGQLVDRGVNPYDPNGNLALRDALRTDAIGSGKGYVTAERGRYDYYVGSNLPASTLLYGAAEKITADDPLSWRLVLLFGDVLIALSAIYFLSRSGAPMTRPNLIAAGALVAIYPALLVWGGLIPQDKQFQTAAMFLLAGALVGAPPQQRFRHAVLVGLVGSVAVWFKAFGVVLAPVALKYFWPRYREIAASAAAFAASSLLFVAPFGMSFLDDMWARFVGAGGAGAQPIHGSPWTLVGAEWTSILRMPVTAMFAIGATYLLIRRKLDLLNYLAAILMAYICLWVVNGSMDRMNMTIMFALLCLFTISDVAARRIIWFNIVAQCLVYAVGAGLGFSPLSETLDAVNAAVFVVSYIATLASLRFLSANHEALGAPAGQIS